MKILVFSMVLSCVSAVLASAGDSAEMLRNRIIFCNEFVIEHPYPAIVLEDTRNCCRKANRLRDCRVNDWDENYR